MPRKPDESKTAAVQLLLESLRNDMHPDVLQRAIAQQRLWYHADMLSSTEGISKLAEESHQLLLTIINKDLPEATANTQSFNT